jgi:hypothetical protein
VGIWRGRPPGIRAERLFAERAADDDKAAEQAENARIAAFLKAHPPRKIKLFPRRRKPSQ